MAATVISNVTSPVMVLLGQVSGNPVATAILSGLLSVLSEQTFVAVTAADLAAVLERSLEVQQLSNGTIILRLVEGENE